MMADEVSDRIVLNGLLERAERVAKAAQLDQRGALEREAECRIAEMGPRAFGERQCIGRAVVGAQQLEALGPDRFDVGMLLEQLAIRVLGVAHAALARQPARAGHHALRWRVGEQIVRRRRPHTENLPPHELLASIAVPGIFRAWTAINCCSNSSGVTSLLFKYVVPELSTVT